jgi:repressor LexA
MPNYAEIMALLEFKSKNSVTKLVKKLEEQGVIETDSKGFLIPKRLFGEVKVLGTVEAGFPSPAEEELIDTTTLDEWLIKRKEATYICKAHGDSMIDAGIMEGDMFLVERGKKPKKGDIVIARLDDGFTVKYLRKEGSAVSLMPGNRKYKAIIPKEGDELEIIAVVTAIIRKHDER